MSAAADQDHARSVPPAPRDGEDLLRDDAPPKVSVLMITYNHERFIAQALDSVLMQRASFPFEIVIGEDNSRDGTRDILRAYQRRHRRTIRLLLHETNVGAHKNFVSAFHACRGEYIALLEGDDWWNDPQKLQRQADLLDRRPDLSAAAHDALSCNEIGGRDAPRYCDPNLPRALTLRDLLVSNHVPTCSVMFRNRLFAEFPEWYYTLPVGDWSLHVLNALHGDMAFDPEPMATYRCHGAGAWSSISREKKIHVELAAYAYFAREVPPRYRNHIRRMVRNRWFELAMISEKGGNLTAARRHLRQSLRAGLTAKTPPDAATLAAALRLFAPALHAAGRGMFHPFKTLARRGA